MIRIKSAEVTTRECEFCKETFRPQKGSAGRFCSRACSGKYRTAHKERFNCAWCGELIEHQIVRSEGYKNYFCSSKCVGMHTASKRPSVTERYWANVSKAEHPKGCWEWISFLDEKGYGRLNIKKGMPKNVNRLAHRFSWELHNGPIPKGLGVLHKCDNPRCVRPDHLFLGTQLDNTNDCIAKGRKPVGEQCSYAKLTEEQVGEMRRRYAEGGISQARLGDEYGVSRRQVQCIVQGKRWKHLPLEHHLIKDC